MAYTIIGCGIISDLAFINTCRNEGFAYCAGLRAPDIAIAAATAGRAKLATTRAGAGAGGAAVPHSPSFVVKSNGEALIVPKGATGPSPVESGKGFMYRGGSGGHGLHKTTSSVRIMDPVTSGKHTYPNGYASYLNAGNQPINPFTGKTVGKSSTWWHWEFMQ